MRESLHAEVHDHRDDHGLLEIDHLRRLRDDHLHHLAGRALCHHRLGGHHDVHHHRLGGHGSRRDQDGLDISWQAWTPTYLAPTQGRN
ncbi:MAG: hypothetical protein QNK83_02855 [Akkermansiaceae bacterium]